MIKFVLRWKAECYCVCLLASAACAESSVQTSDPVGRAQPSHSQQPERRSSADAARDADAGTTADAAAPPSSGSARDAQQPDGALATDDAGINSDASTIGPIVQPLQPGVVLSADSSITLASAASRASYLPAQPGCSAEYQALFSADQQMTSAIEIGFGDAEKLGMDYPLQREPCEDCGASSATNFLVGDGINIQVNVNGIEAPDTADNVTMGSIRFRSLTGNLQFDFSFYFSDGKRLRGTFNLPIKQDLICPGPF
ncbi:MAG TPA: hypothetical protein VGI70_19455 [Polyangiales bacterium]